MHGLQSDEFGHFIPPALPAAAAIGGPLVADDRGADMADAIARLAERAFGPGAGVVTEAVQLLI